MRNFENGTSFLWASSRSDEIIVDGEELGEYTKYFKPEVNYSGPLGNQNITLIHKKTNTEFTFQYGGNI